MKKIIKWIYLIQDNQLNLCWSLKEKNLKSHIYIIRFDFNASDLGNHNYSSENEINSIEDFEGVEDEETQKESNEALNFKNAKQQLLKMSIDKSYSIYQMNKNNLIDSA